MQDYLLDHEYEFDVIFNDGNIFPLNSYGKIKLSQRGIYLDVICHYDNIFNKKFNKIINCINCFTIDKKKITIFNALPNGYKGTFCESNDKTPNAKFHFRAQYCVIGKHINSLNNDNKITSISIKQNNLIQWIDKSIVEHTHDSDFAVENFKISHEPAFYKMEIPNLGTIDFYISAITEFNAYKNPEYDINYFINTKFLNNKTLNESIEYLTRWEILYSLFMGQSYNFDSIYLTIENEKQGCYLYYIKDTKYPYNLHYIEVPLPCDKINNQLNTIFSKWFSIDDTLKHSSILFFRALNQKDIKEGFLDAIKATEGFLEKYNKTFFDENTLKDLILPNIKESLLSVIDDKKLIDRFVQSIKNTNKFRRNLENKLNKMIIDYNLQFLFPDMKLINKMVSYRNILSHNKGEEKYKNIDINILYEAYLKLMVILFILFMHYLEIDINNINYAINRNNFLKILMDNKKIN